jgi:hypothetical protein
MVDNTRKQAVALIRYLQFRAEKEGVACALTADQIESWMRQGAAMMFGITKFVGRLIRKPERAHGFTTLALTLDGSDVMGVNEVHALLDPEALDRKGVANEALKWNAGDLVELEGEVFKIGKCECCGNPIPVVDAFKCCRAGH